jgi:hypothetical protein
MNTAITCPYCSRPAALVTGKVIYPHRKDLHEKTFWACMPCKAWVGCHPGTDVALGRLANEELRNAKRAAHAAFDPLWQPEVQTGSKNKRRKMRDAAYDALARVLNIPREECHIGMFDLDRCTRTVEACKTLKLGTKG